MTWGLLLPAVLLAAAYLKDSSAHWTLAPGALGMTLLLASGVFVPLSEMPRWLLPVAYPSPWIPLAASTAFLAGSFVPAGAAFRNRAQR